MQCLHNTDCSDGNFCTFNVCDNGTCTFPPRNCDDTIACTVDGCDPASGCTHTPDDTQCNDFLDCTNDLCDPTFGCDHQPVDSRCVDGILCTVDFCDLQQGCVHQPSDARCDDGNPCTTDRCDPTSGSSDGCVHLPIPNCVTCSSPGFPCARQCVPCAPVSFVQPCDFVCSDQGVCVQTQTCGPCSLNCQP